MTIQELISIEDQAKEVWVISPSLHYDLENNDFSEIVSVNLDQKCKYKYIIPVHEGVHERIEIYKNKYNLTPAEVRDNFLILQDNDLDVFLLETGIYNGNSDECRAFAASPNEEDDSVIMYNAEASKMMASNFKKIWKKFKGQNA